MNHTMPRGRLLRIEEGTDTVVRVREGAVWLTQEGDGHDRYLRAGDSFRLDRPGLTIVQALRNTTLSVSVPRPAPSLGGFLMHAFSPRRG
jgi:hypothetical protein